MNVDFEAFPAFESIEFDGDSVLELDCDELGKRRILYLRFKILKNATSLHRGPNILIASPFKPQNQEGTDRIWSVDIVNNGKLRYCHDILHETGCIISEDSLSEHRDNSVQFKWTYGHLHITINRRLTLKEDFYGRPICNSKIFYGGMPDNLRLKNNLTRRLNFIGDLDSNVQVGLAKLTLTFNRQVLTMTGKLPRAVLTQTHTDRLFSTFMDPFPIFDGRRSLICNYEFNSKSRQVVWMCSEIQESTDCSRRNCRLQIING